MPPLVRLLLHSTSESILSSSLTVLFHACSWHQASCGSAAPDARIFPALLQLLERRATSGARHTAGVADLLGLLEHTLPDVRSAILASGGAAAHEAVLRCPLRSGESIGAHKEPGLLRPLRSAARRARSRSCCRRWQQPKASRL